MCTDRQTHRETEKSDLLISTSSLRSPWRWQSHCHTYCDLRCRWTVAKWDRLSTPTDKTQTNIGRQTEKQRHDTDLRCKRTVGEWDRQHSWSLSEPHDVQTSQQHVLLEISLHHHDTPLMNKRLSHCHTGTVRKTHRSILGDTYSARLY